jgi:hypothetical protein
MVFVDPHTRIERLLVTQELQFQKAFLSVVKTIRDRHTLAEIALLLEQGRFNEALEGLARAATQLGTSWTESFIISGREGAKVLRRALGEVVIDFDVVNTRAVDAMRQNQLRLVREFSRSQVEATRSALLEGISKGQNPIAQARTFRDSIGLTKHQSRAVENFRRMLEERDPTSLRRKLRDRRFDSTVRRSIREDRPLTPKQINKMVRRYRERFIKHRSQTIARTEALSSVHEGNQEMMRQAIDSGALNPAQIVQIWNIAGDERVRNSHGPMQGQERPIGIPFTSGSGASLRHPGDATAPAEERIQCRCALGMRILSLEELGSPGLVGMTLV